MINFLGILLYELFHFSPPFDTRDVNILKKLLSNFQLKLNPKLDVRIRNLIQKILKINPLDRPTCSEILNDRGLIELINKFHILVDQSSIRKTKKFQ